MRTNVAQVITLLSTESLRKQKKDVHEAILRAITSPDDGAYFRESTRFLLRSYDADKHRYDEYWIPVFEAYVIGNYDNATYIAEQFIEHLPKDEYRNVSRAYPPLIIALLKAYNWAEQHTDTPNHFFGQRLPEFLATLLRLDSLYGSPPGDEWNPQIDGWARGRLTAAMNDYFHRGHPDFWTRMEKFCLGVQPVTDTVNGGTPLLRIVAHELNSHMPAQMALRAATNAWLAAKKLTDTNERRASAS